MPKEYYAVRVGRKAGIYRSWQDTKEQVHGFKGAVYKGFENEAEAAEFLGVALRPVKKLAVTSIAVPIAVPIVVPVPTTRRPITIQPAHLPALERIVRNEGNLHTLHVDGGHNRQTGLEGWGRVVDAVGVDLLAPYIHLFPDFRLRDVVLPRMGASYVLVAKFNDVKQQQVNGAELMALVAGLRIADHLKDKVHVIGSDSTTVLFWSRTLGSEARARMDPRKVALVEECIRRRREFEGRGGQVIKISGDDNLGDLGRH
jgi:ribonuclease HI